MQAGKPEESPRRVSRLWVALRVGVLIVLAALIVILVLDAVQLGLDWSNPWTSGKRNGGKLGGLTFLTYVGMLSAWCIEILGHLRKWAMAKRWGHACLVIWFAFLISRFAFSPDFGPAVRAAIFVSSGLMAVLIFSPYLAGAGRRAAKNTANAPTEGPR